MVATEVYHPFLESLCHTLDSFSFLAAAVDRAGASPLVAVSGEAMVEAVAQGKETSGRFKEMVQVSLKVERGVDAVTVVHTSALDGAYQKALHVILALSFLVAGSSGLEADSDAVMLNTRALRALVEHAHAARALYDELASPVAEL